MFCVADPSHGGGDADQSRDASQRDSRRNQRRHRHQLDGYVPRQRHGDDHSDRSHCRAAPEPDRARTLGGIESITCGSRSRSSPPSARRAFPVARLRQGRHSTRPRPSGSINGSNTSFTLSPTPTDSANVNCFENGVQQQQGSGNDYTISGATITYLTAPPTGSKLNCLWY